MKVARLAGPPARDYTNSLLMTIGFLYMISIRWSAADGTHSRIRSTAIFNS